MNLDLMFEWAESSLKLDWMIEIEIYEGETSVILYGPNERMERMPKELLIAEQIKMAVEASHAS